MKIIELLNLVYENKAPKKIKWNNEVWNYMKSENDYTNSQEFLLMDNIMIYENVKSFLSFEVEIIEDKPEKIDKINEILRIDDLIPPYGENLSKVWKNIIINHNKLNEIIDKLNYLLENSIDSDKVLNQKITNYIKNLSVEEKKNIFDYYEKSDKDE